MVLCSAVLLFRRAKKDATLGEVTLIALLRGVKFSVVWTYEQMHPSSGFIAWDLLRFSCSMIQLLPVWVWLPSARLIFVLNMNGAVWQLNKSYLEFCKSNSMHALAGSEFSSMCRVLADQVSSIFLGHWLSILMLSLSYNGLLSLYQSSKIFTFLHNECSWVW